MFSNYITIALRNLLRNKLYALINLLGLAIGLACCVIALAIIYHEYSYDRFHAQSDRIYRVLRERISNDQKQVRWLTSGALARTIENEIPEIEYTSKNRTYGVTVRYQDQTQILGKGHVDDKFFDLFDFKFIQGNSNLLKQPYHMAITERAASRLFGAEDPIGKVITVQERYYAGDYTISAVIQTPPATSTLQFDLLHQTEGKTFEAKFDWNEWQGRVQQAGIETFILLRPGADAKALEDKLSGIIERHMGTEIRAILSYRLQALHRLHLYGSQDFNLIDWRPRGNIQHLYIFAAVALLILFIAVINFINLATAQSLQRAQEVGLRKVVGAQRKQLLTQFLGESILLTLFAFGLSLIVASLSLSQINTLTQNRFALSPESFVALLPLFILLSICVGLGAGLYPAFYLSKFHPITTLKGTVQSSRARFRQVLVVTQFAIAIVLIVATYIVDRQQHFMRNKDLGFQQEQLVVLPLFLLDRESKVNNEPWIAAQYNTVKNTFLQHSNILAASAYRFRPGWGGGFVRIVKPEGHENTEWRMPVQEADEDFFNTLNIPLLAGRTFSPDNERDRTHAYILNRTAVNALGWTVEDAVGRRFGRARSEEDAKGTVIGVVEDFHYASLREAIQPAAIGYRQWFYQSLALRIRPEGWGETRDFLEATWRKFMAPDIPFTFYFMNEEIETIYQAEEQFGQLVTFFSGLAILLACLGLFGLATFTAERRTREIGVRKVLGASVGNIVLLLSKEFLKLVLISNLIAWPVAYYATTQWLQTFAYRVDLNISPFILSGIVALLIALLTVAYQAFKAARTNPVETLRYE